MQPRPDTLDRRTTATGEREEGLLGDILCQRSIMGHTPCCGVDHASVHLHELAEGLRVAVMMIAAEQDEIGFHNVVSRRLGCICFTECCRSPEELFRANQTFCAFCFPRLKRNQIVLLMRDCAMPLPELLKSKAARHNPILSLVLVQI